ncbi:hypothetical protein BK658_16860 [Pseudomonas brassicacearum]|uniref:Uncharacterized protein n=1 Tax=Pseudomonas brassicacearum TaxID=930166 RepID=A0A423GPQ4_9PSED|nr:hypothetical protein BK658_16860 [Pseudomonas brassicacearum]
MEILGRYSVTSAQLLAHKGKSLYPAKSQIRGEKLRVVLGTSTRWCGQFLLWIEQQGHLELFPWITWIEGGWFGNGS